MGKELQRGLAELDEKIRDLSAMVVEQITESVRCFMEKDLSGAANVINNDSRVNKLRWEIEELCVYLIAVQQPVASDLRKLISGTHVTVELERIGDYAEGIAKITRELPAKFDVKKYPELQAIFRKMQELSCEMLNESIEAFFTRDVEEAIRKSEGVCRADDEVDDLCRRIYDFIHSFRDSDLTDEESKDVAMKLSWAAHDLERSADRSTNIAERTVYLVTGKMVENIHPSRY